MWSSIFTAGFPLHYTEEVRHALVTGQPTVALETTIITHGMPHPHNLTSVCSIIIIFYCYNIIYCRIFFLHRTYNFLYFMGRASLELKIPTLFKRWNMLLPKIKSTNLCVHVHVRCLQTTKFRSYEFKWFHIT